MEWPLFLALTFFFPAISAFVLIIKAASLAVTDRRLPANRVTAWLEAAILLLCIAFIVYATGMWTAPFVDFSGENICTERPLRDFRAVSQNYFPLEYLCHWNDETTTDSVPAYVNPIVFACLTGIVFCIAMAIRSARRRRAQET